ncbi:MAG: hypothetical protein K2H13_00795, partial [Eubacterium sp.]|nr:hypothetical protein [Eubacterium sp.]
LTEDYDNDDNSDIELLLKYCNKTPNKKTKSKRMMLESNLYYSDIDKYLYSDREIIYSIINRIHETKETREAIRNWLKEIDKKRELLNTTDFIDEL